MLGSNYVSSPMILPGLYEFQTLAGSNYTILPANVFETENLDATTTGGNTHQTLINSACSNLRGTRFDANAAGDFVAYAITNVTASAYQLRVVADCGSDHARFQLACGPPGSVTNVGPVHETYSATNLVYLLPTNALTTTLLWTNRLREFDCGEWTAPTNGNYEFRFTVVDKNAASSGFSLSFDHIKLTPANAALPVVKPPPTLSASAQAGSLILSWSTNGADYSLERASEVTAANWSPAPPPPAISAGLLMVTNAMTEERVFYRLHKP
jgi:hypothetical protein